MKKPHHIFKVSILYKDNKRKEYDSTDFPNIGGDWITIYQYAKRLMIPTIGVAEIEYDIVSA